MKTKIFIFSFFVVMMILTSCTQNQRAKNFGGKAEIVLPKGKKLVMATWKDDNLWYLTRDMRPEENAEVYQFAEESSFGFLNGNYTITEQK